MYEYCFLDYDNDYHGCVLLFIVIFSLSEILGLIKVTGKQKSFE